MQVIAGICVLVWIININHFKDPALGGWVSGEQGWAGSLLTGDRLQGFAWATSPWEDMPSSPNL
jgi:hypothetical protein